MSADSLKTLTIRGFKSIKDVTLEMRPINLVIGPNGSGKSNLLGAFELLHAVRDGRLAEYTARQGGAERILHFGSKVTSQVSFVLSFEDRFQYVLQLIPRADDSLTVAGQIGGGGTRVDFWRLYHLHDTSTSSPMRKTAQIDDNRFLRADASNLAAFLYLLSARYPDSFERIQQTVRLVAPFFDRFDLQPDRLNSASIKLVWRHANSDHYFDAASLSDGTLRFIALATLFLQPRELRPSVILIDEPELGLHPYAIEMLAALIRQTAPETQVVVSTQSSLLLDHFAPEDVVVANRVEGATTLTRLEPAALASWLEEYSLGQLWEKNEFAGRPVPE